MKKRMCFVCLLLVVLLAACGGEEDAESIIPGVTTSRGAESGAVSANRSAEPSPEPSLEPSDEPSVEASAEESEPGESIPDESEPEESQPEESQPEESEPEESQPEESEPEELPSDLSTLKYRSNGIDFDDNYGAKEQTVLKALCGDNTVLYFEGEDRYVVLPQRAEWICGAQYYGTYLFFAFAPEEEDVLNCYHVYPNEGIRSTVQVRLPKDCPDARVFASWAEDMELFLSVVSEKTGETLGLYAYSYTKEKITGEIEMLEAPVCSTGMPALMRFVNRKVGVLVYHRNDRETSVFFTRDGGKTWEGFGKGFFGIYRDPKEQIIDFWDVSCGGNVMYAVATRNGDKITRYAGGDPLEWMYSEVLSWQEVPAELDGYRLKAAMGDYDLLFWGENGKDNLIWCNDKTYTVPVESGLTMDMKGFAVMVYKSADSSEFTVQSLLYNGETFITKITPPYHSGGEEAEELTAYLQVIDYDTAVIAITGVYGSHMEEQLLAFYRTEDRGETWTNVQPQSTYYAWDYREDMVIFHFFDGNTGIRSRDYRIPELLEWRTMVTFDGGRDWQTIHDLPYPGKTTGYTEIVEVGECDGVYWMRVYSSETDGKPAYLFFVSADLINWTYVDVDGEAFVIDQVSSDLNVIVGKDGDGYVVRVASWNQTFHLSGAVYLEYDMAGDTLLVCLAQENGWEDYVSFDVYRLVKGKDEPVVTVLTVPETIDEHETWRESAILQVVDENTAFVSVIAEVWEDEWLYAIYRTTDGGYTWEDRLEKDIIWDACWADYSAFHFWDADKGIMCRYVFHDEPFTERVLITLDGGKTWNEIRNIVMEEEDPDSLMVGSADYKDGVYSISLFRFGEPSVTVATYVSTDLLNWIKR